MGVNLQITPTDLSGALVSLVLKGEFHLRVFPKNSPPILSIRVQNGHENDLGPPFPPRDHSYVISSEFSMGPEFSER